MIPAREALDRLREGNLRFAANVRGSDAFVSHTRRAELPSGQEPFAIILGCSDSRVPAEIVFDQGLGDLFVIRVAGNIVAPSQVGSVEFAAARFDAARGGARPLAVRRDPRAPSRSWAALRRNSRETCAPSSIAFARRSNRYSPATSTTIRKLLVQQAVRANIRAFRRSSASRIPGARGVDGGGDRCAACVARRR